jgi:hypothetical protein
MTNNDNDNGMVLSHKGLLRISHAALKAAERLSPLIAQLGCEDLKKIYNAFEQTLAQPVYGWRSDYKNAPKDGSFVLLRNLQNTRLRMQACQWDNSTPDYPWHTINKCDAYPEDTFNEFHLILQEGFKNDK